MGADFLVYDKDPHKEHAKAVVFLNDNLNLVEINRIGTILNKDSYIAV